MSFWSFNTAAPSYWHTWFSFNGDFLRKIPALCPLDMPKYSRYRRLLVSDRENLGSFLREHYGDPTWYLDTGSWLDVYLEDPNTIVLGLFDTSEMLCACIFSSPLPKDSQIGLQRLSNIRVIEGLCVHKAFRKSGLANYLLSAIDYETSRQGPTVHLYSRELPNVPLLSTHLNAKLYAYIECTFARPTLQVSKMEWDIFQTLWASNKDWKSSGDLVSPPFSMRGDLSVWQVEQSVIVVANTRRRARRDNAPIWEIAWCGTILYGMLYPSRVLPSHLESVAAEHTGLFFCMNEHFAEPVQEGTWHIGQSGYHAWYIYNYLVPKFGSLELQMVREEI